MKEFGGFWYPDSEVHMIAWCEKHGVSMFGRTAYQGKKQLATIDICTKLGRLRTAIDVGAHVGHWSFNLAHHFAQVEAFEPVAAHRECWMKNVEAVCAMLYPNALGAKPGHVSMQVEAGNSGNSSVRLGDGDVDMVTLDSCGFSDVDLIKIDTEGFEVQVLQGAAGTVARDKPVVIVEQKRDMGAKYGNKPQEAVELLKSWGYRVVADLSGDFLCVHKSLEVPS